MENQNLNDPSKDNVINEESNHPIVEPKNNLQQDPILDEHVYKEETATEFTEDTIRDGPDRDRDRDEVNNVYGWIAIALSAISFFLIPILFAGAGIILGFIARNREAQILGNTAIVIGILSIIIRLFIMPLI